MDLRVQSTVGCFPELCFLQFSVAQVLVVLRKQFINNFVFPTWASALVLIIIIIISIIHSSYLLSYENIEVAVYPRIYPIKYLVKDNVK